MYIVVDGLMCVSVLPPGLFLAHLS
jgi:hypothetical protein